MTLPKYKELSNLTKLDEIQKELFVLQKNLFDLRVQKLTSQSVKNHLFSHTKRRISQLKFKIYELSLT
jgi:ribosomal protein L29